MSLSLPAASPGLAQDATARAPAKLPRLTVPTLSLAVAWLCTSIPAQARDLPVLGGPGGAPFRTDCSSEFVVGFYVRSGHWIDAVGLKCSSYTDNNFKQPPWNKPYHGGNGGGGPHTQLCPTDTYPTAIKFGHTRDGNKPKFLDFIEFTCTAMLLSPRPSKAPYEYMPTDRERLLGQAPDWRSAFVHPILRSPGSDQRPSRPRRPVRRRARPDLRSQACASEEGGQAAQNCGLRPRQDRPVCRQQKSIPPRRLHSAGRRMHPSGRSCAGAHRRKP